ASNSAPARAMHFSFSCPQRWGQSQCQPPPKTAAPSAAVWPQPLAPAPPELRVTENSGNGIGAFASGGAAQVIVSLKDSHISGNAGNGIGVLASAASGAGSVTVVGASLISGNVNGVSASGAGQIRTHGNNQLLFNGNN